MTSPRPITRSLSSIRAMVNASKHAPPVSRPGTDGTQEGASRSTRRGSPAVCSSMYAIPSSPITLPISWGSASTVVVPWGSTASANPLGSSILLSICTWVSISPGTAYFPPPSYSFRPRGGASPGWVTWAILSPFTAMAAG